MSTDTLKALFDGHQDKVTDKWSSYLDTYESALATYREKTRTLLEIGVQNGGSLQIWAKYFKNAETIIGCDVENACSELLFDDERIHVIVGDANSPDVLEKVSLFTSSFDIIIDDGSHKSSDIIASIVNYLPLLDENGLFIIEDLHCSYWRDFEGGLHYPYSAIAFLTRLIDIINYEHWGLELDRSSHLEEFLTHFGINNRLDTLNSIHSIEFTNSVAIIRKREPRYNTLGERHVAGTEAQVVPELLAAKPTMPLVTQLEVLPDPLHELPTVKTALRIAQEEISQLKLNIKNQEEELRLAEKNKTRIVELQQALEVAHNEHSSLAKQLVAAIKQLNDTNNQMKSARAELQAIRSSKIWRYTSFIRRFGTQIKAFKTL